MIAKQLNDSLDNLFEGDKTADGSARVQPPVAYTAAKEAGIWENCPRCRGSGQTPWGVCFKCKGSKGRTFKTTASQRAAARDSAHARAQNKIAETWKAFFDANPEAAAWIESNRATFEFAQAMRDAVERFGSLTENQMAAVQRSIDKRKAMQAERAAQDAARPVVDTAGVDRLKLAFNTAIANASAKGRGFKMPRITIGGMVISPAKAESQNAGALYVKQAGQYLGKVNAGRFFAARECSPAQEKQVLAFIADPKAAAIAYGIETGVCCICNATLTNKVSIEAGIGPICATNFGW